MCSFPLLGRHTNPCWCGVRSSVCVVCAHECAVVGCMSIGQLHTS